MIFDMHGLSQALAFILKLIIKSFLITSHLSQAMQRKDIDTVHAMA
jgi:hypothetical protein